MTVHANLTVSIRIGNDAVQSGTDVADLLRHAATMISIRTIREIDDHSIPLLDLNGNRVGSVQVTGFEEEAVDNVEVGRYAYAEDTPRGDDEGEIISVKENTVTIASYIHNDFIVYDRRLVTVPLHD